MLAVIAALGLMLLATACSAAPTANTVATPTPGSQPSPTFDVSTTPLPPVPAASGTPPRPSPCTLPQTLPGLCAGRPATVQEEAEMTAVGKAGIEREYGWKDWSACSNGEACFKVSQPSRAMVGTHAGVFDGGNGLYPGGGLGSACWIFVYQDSDGWHYSNAGCAQNPGYVPGVGAHVFVTGGCANFRNVPGLSSRVLGCLKNGTIVDVDSAPVYLNAHIWWHLVGRGWMAHDFLVKPHRAVGTFTHYTTPSAGSVPGGITAGPDGNVWFTEEHANRVAKVTVTGTFTEYLVPTPNSIPIDIAAGRDGNLWVTEGNADKIARVTTRGVFTEYALPRGSSPEYIVSGPDGNLWFTEYGTNSVAKITTSGVQTHYTIPTPGSGPTDIAPGPDGNLWFLERTANKVAKLTRSGTFTEYRISTPDSFLQGIAAGSDGNLWFTEQDTNRVAKITTSGVITEYAVPTEYSLPQIITAGPDGNLWFTENYGPKIAKVTTAGVITEYLIPRGNSGPYSITTGPDGNIWFTASFISEIISLAI